MKMLIRLTLVWGAAAASLVLLVPIFTLTFHIKVPPDPMHPQVYLDNLRATLMQLTILAAFAISAGQSLTGAKGRKRFLLMPHLGIWLFLGTGLAALSVFRPMPPPLLATVGGQTYEVPRDYLPRFSKQMSPLLTIRICRDPVRTSHPERCLSSTVQIRQADEGYPFMGATSNLARHGLEADGGRLAGLGEQGELVEVHDGARLYSVGDEGDGLWYWVTTDMSGTVTRVAACFPDSKRCSVRVMTRLGELGYDTTTEAAQAVAARGREEDALVRLFEGMQKARSGRRGLT